MAHLSSDRPQALADASPHELQQMIDKAVEDALAKPYRDAPDGPDALHPSRRSSNTPLPKVLGGEPFVPLGRGLAVTFERIAAQVCSKGPVSAMISATTD